jgi:hypothetical protein
MGTHGELLERGGPYASMWQAFEMVGRSKGGPSAGTTS